MEVYKLSDDTWDIDEYKAIDRVIKSGRFTMGNEVKNFETTFAQKMGVKFAVMSNSGSSANLLAIAALIYSKKLKTGDEVIVPAVSWSTTYFPLTQYNLKLKFVDIDKNTLNIDVNQLSKAITKKTKALFMVNLLGNPNEFDEILKICEKHNLILIEDNCESLGAQYKGKNLGSFGLLGTFSTFYSHHICTMEGGVTITNDEELYHYMLSLRAHGWTRNLPQESRIYSKNPNEFYESFNFILPGYNLRPLEIEAAIGTEQLKKLDAIIIQRRKNAEYFIKRIANISSLRIQKEVEHSSWFGFAIILQNDARGQRDTIIEILRGCNIEVRPIVAGNFTRNPVIKYMDYSIYGTLVNSDDIHDNGFFVGNHSISNKDNVDRLIDELKKVLK
jgi:CDP-4-dehydro-6-deoxyglucose reductase, E1